ncbi:MAG: hypothetical protein IID18_03540 [Nitrospinae bacterium]|nr:hypothetical protein [Nitrospinota bacterium]
MGTINNSNRAKNGFFNMNRTKGPRKSPKSEMDLLHEWNLKTLEEMYGKEYAKRYMKSS